LRPPGVNFHCHTHSASKRLEGCFNDVMGIDAIELADVERHLGMIHHRYKKLAYQLGVVGTDPLGGNL
jgi:hypothetical protein